MEVEPLAGLEEPEDDITIVGIHKAGVTQPSNDATRGSALYTVPIKLSRRPSDEWSRFFVEAWDHPESFTTQHRPRIASVVRDTIVLTGTTLEEVDKVHKPVLIAAVKRANDGARAFRAAQKSKTEADRKEKAEFRKHVDEASDKITFE
jgi:hypothetical protein